MDKALANMFRGFSFYSEPVEEREVQRQIREYLKLKSQFKQTHLKAAKEALKPKFKAPLPIKTNTLFNHNYHPKTKEKLFNGL